MTTLDMSDKTNEIKKKLLAYKEVLIDKLQMRKYDEVLALLYSIIKPYQLTKVNYDRTVYTPYDDEVVKKYDLSNYVNASIIPTKNKLYIAAQNPKAEDETKFLELISKSNVDLIVSLIEDPTYLKEEWLINRDIIRYNGKVLFFDELYSFSDRKIRRLRYLCWPDFGVIPAEDMEYFYRYYRKIKCYSVLVHCLIGIGRTGTFIAYDLLRSMKIVNLEIFVDLLIELRSRRTSLVLSKPQLVFLLNVFVYQ